MAAKVKWDRGAWWVFTHYEGKRKKKRIGATKAHKREAEEIARKINGALALGTFAPQREEAQSVAFDEYANDWLHREVLLPARRGIEGALSPATAALHERHVRRYLIPFFGDRDLRGIRVADVQALHDHCVETGRPPSARSIEMVLATLRRVFAQAETHELIGRNPVEVWKRGRGRRRRSSAYRVEPDNVLDSDELRGLLDTARRDFPSFYPLILFLADTGARLGEASAVRWIDVNLEVGMARVCRSFSSGKHLTETKTGASRTVELSTRLGELLRQRQPDLFGDDDLVFPSDAGGFLDPHNFRDRVFRRLVQKVLGRGRRFTPHGLRHTFASLHLARGTNLKWVQAQGGWASAKVLLDCYGHYLATESTGFADALSGAPERPYTAPLEQRSARRVARLRKVRRTSRGSVAPRGGIEPPTPCLEGRCSIRLSYRGAAPS